MVLDDSENGAGFLEYGMVPKDLEFREAVLEMVLAFDGGPLRKLEGSMRFLAGG